MGLHGTVVCLSLVYRLVQRDDGGKMLTRLHGTAPRETGEVHSIRNPQSSKHLFRKPHGQHVHDWHKTGAHKHLKRTCQNSFYWRRMALDDAGGADESIEMNDNMASVVCS
jgi:hypothetical protein